MLMMLLCSLSIVGETPVVSTPYIIPVIPAARAQTAVLTPDLLSRWILFPFTRVSFSLFLTTLVHLLRPELEAVPNILAHRAQLTLPDFIILEMLLAKEAALAVTTDFDADTVSSRRVSRMSITKSVALARMSLTASTSLLLARQLLPRSPPQRFHSWVRQT